MLKRNRKNAVNTNMLLFNGAGVLVGLVIVGYTVSSYFKVEVIPPCSARYPSAMQLTFQTAGGAALSPIELQSRAGQAEWGVMENAQIVKIAGAPAAAVLEVKLDKAPNTAPEGVNIGGMGMIWVPHNLEGAAAGCLSYSVYIPDSFDMSGTGTLPGLYGGPRPETLRGTSGSEPGFFSRLIWNRDGGIELSNRFTGAAGVTGHSLVVDRFVMPRGRWVPIEQELALNKPGASDGTARLWVDGKLRVDKKDLAWRKDDLPQISGVLFDVTTPATAKSASLRIAPPVFGWR